MKKILSGLLGVILSLSMMAQIPAWTADSITQGQGYINDNFYSLKSGNQKVENNKNWHIAFYMKAVDQTAPIRANHTNNVAVYNPHKSISQWASISLADTAATDTLYNSEIKWSKGALNQNANVANPFNYGWGTYDQTSHNIFGDSIYFIKIPSGWYALQIDSLVGGTNDWYFKIVSLTSPSIPAQTIITKSPNYGNRMFAYYNIDSMFTKDREPVDSTWDILFTRYKSYATFGPTTAWYNVTGVVSNQKVKVIRSQNILVDDAYTTWSNSTNLATNLATMNTNINNIGWDWKIPQTTTVYNPDSNSYFILDRESNLWQFRFTAFTSGAGPSSSQTNFEKRHVAFPVAVSTIPSAISRYTLYPQPATYETTLLLESTTNTTATITMASMLGTTCLSKVVKIKAGINAFTIPTSAFAKGNYILSLRGERIKLDTKMTIN